MASLCDSVRRHTPGTFVVCSSVVNGFQSFRLSLEQQIDALATSVSVEPRLAGGFHAIGLSQGGLVLRGYVERGHGPPVRRLITISTPHAGIGACPAGGAWAYVCTLFCFSPYNFPISFSAYWKDVADGREAYLSKSTWLADANNERDCNNNNMSVSDVYDERDRNNTPAFEAERVDNHNNNNNNDNNNNNMARRRSGMLSLERYVLIEALNDTFVVPRESTTHGYWAWGRKGVVVPLRESEGYSDDSLGLRTLDESGRLRTAGYEGDHLGFNASFWEGSVLSQLEG